MKEITIRDETLFLHHEKAIWWPKRRTLLVADTHLSKDSVFREHGIPLPSGNNIRDLTRLTSLIAETRAERLIVLGDFVHGALSPNDPLFTQLQKWRKTNEQVSLEVVSGNHDRHIDKNALEGVVWHQQLSLAPFSLVHEPVVNDQSYTLAGHIHPVISLSDRKTDRIRLPVFWFQASIAILPSFGSMTGGFVIKAGKGDTLFAAGPDAVIKIR